MNSHFLNSAVLVACTIVTGGAVLAIMASQITFSWKKPAPTNEQLPTPPKGGSVTAPPKGKVMTDEIRQAVATKEPTGEVSGEGLPPDTYLGRVHVDTSQKSLKRLIGDTEQYKPWKNHYTSDDFHSWYRWIIDATQIQPPVIVLRPPLTADLQQLVSKMPMSDAERLYFLMSDMMRNAHRNHALLGPVCDYSNHGPDCDCGRR